MKMICKQEACRDARLVRPLKTLRAFASTIMHIYPQFHSNRCPKAGEQAARTQKPHGGFVVYRAVLACNANAVIGQVIRKQRCKCCVLFQSECFHGAFGTRKRASIKTTQHPWCYFRAHSADRVASLRSATLPCKQRNRDAVYCYWRRSVASHLLYKR